MKIQDLKFALLCGASAIAGSAAASTDYGPAIWRPVCSGKWYTSGYGFKFHVVHDMEGYYLSSISYLQQCGVSSSVHYAVNGLTDSSDNGAAPGEISQLVSEAYYAWHASCWNLYSTGTEHEGFASNPAWYTEQMYQASAGLFKHLCDKNGTPKDRNHIVAHGEKSNGNWCAYAEANFGIDAHCNTHTDPGPYWDWNHFMSLITFNNTHINPVAGLNSDGRVEIFAIGKSGLLYHSYQTNGGSWTTWAAIGGWTFAANAIPAVQRNSDGRLEVFVPGSDGKMDHVYQTAAGNSASWSGWSQIGTWTSSSTAYVAAGANQDGRIEVFVVGTDGQLNHVYQTTAGNSASWSGWSHIGGNWNQNAAISVGSESNGCLNVFLIGNTGNLYNLYQTAPNAGWASSWNNLGGTWPTTQRTAVASNADGRLEMFVIGNTGYLYHAWETAANSPTTWSGWGALGTWQFSSAAKPVAARNSNNTLEVLAIGNDGHLDRINSANWNSWSGLTGSPAFSQDIRPVMAVNGDGHLEVFLTAPASDMVHAYQNAPSGAWGGWPSLGGSWN